MLRFNNCPRCKGTLVLDKDQYGWYEQCLQCGYLRDLETIVSAEQQAGLEQKKRRKLARAPRVGGGIALASEFEADDGGLPPLPL